MNKKDIIIIVLIFLLAAAAFQVGRVYQIEFEESRVIHQECVSALKKPVYQEIPAPVVKIIKRENQSDSVKALT